MSEFIENKDIEKEFNQALKTIENNWALNLERQLLYLRETIAQQMEKKGLSRSDLAKLLNSSRAYITQLLNGNSNIRLSTLFKIAFALELRPNIQLDYNNTEELKEFRKSDQVHYRKTGKLRIVIMHNKVTRGEYEPAEIE